MTSQTFRNQPRRSFSRAFKKEVVELLLQDAATVAEVAREYDLHPNLLCRWRSNYLRGHYAGVAETVDEPTDFLAVTVLPADGPGDMATAVTPATAPEDA
ncbi:MAG: transposase, partial [Pigmentiphaga sp.]